jgi:invasion protein IalB
MAEEAAHLRSSTGSAGSSGLACAKALDAVTSAARPMAASSSKARTAAPALRAADSGHQGWQRACDKLARAQQARQGLRTAEALPGRRQQVHWEQQANMTH